MDGKQDRVNGPARVCLNQAPPHIGWYRKGRLHRVGGPALLFFKKEQCVHAEWRVHGLLHREDGPAVSRVGAEDEWWFNGLQMPGPVEEIAQSWDHE